MATIEIDTIDKLIDFSNGVYGRGTSDSLLDVVLTADLDFEDASLVNWPGCTGSWYVNLDGQDHTISNIYFNGSGNWGFFETFKSGTITNLNIDNIQVTATGTAGVIANSIENITIENVHISGDVGATGYCACFCPNGSTGTRVARNCSFTGSLTSTGSFCSLLTTEGDTVGFSTYNFTAICDIFSASNLYLVTSYNAPITDNLFFRGTLKGNSNIYIGAWRGGGVTNSLFVLEDDSRSGSTYGTLTNCYYDSSGAAVSGLTGVTTEEMKSRSWLNNHNFDSDIWKLDDKNEGYPYSVEFIEYVEQIFEIGTAQELIDFSHTSNHGTFAHKLNVKLTADIDLSGLTWSGFTGIWYINFDGQGHNVDNIYYASHTWALFYEIHGSIKNLKLSNVYVITVNDVSPYAIFAYDTTIENCSFSGYLESTQYASGCVQNGYNTHISNCSYSGILKNYSTNYAFAWIGGGNNNNSVDNCLFVGTMIANGTGTVFGFRAAYRNCEFKGIIQCDTLQYGSYNGSLSNCILICENGSQCNSVSSYGSLSNSYYDSDKASSAGISGITNLTAATTEQLKSIEWLREHNFLI